MTTNEGSNAAKNKILCLFKEPFKDPVQVEVEDDFHAIQNQVGCDTFQCLEPFEDVCYFIDDEGKFKPLAKPNIRYGIDDIIVGNILIAGIRGENNVSLTEWQIGFITKRLKSDSITPHQAVMINVRDYI